MGLSAQRLSAGRIVADAFQVRDAVLRDLIAELENHAPRQRADALAKRLGLQSRFQMAHRLSRARLPTLVGLRAILRVVAWVERWETEGIPLARQALTAGQDPAAWSKTVRHVTGRSWSEIRLKGAQDIASELATRFRGGSGT